MARKGPRNRVRRRSFFKSGTSKRPNLPSEEVEAPGFITRRRALMAMGGVMGAGLLAYLGLTDDDNLQTFNSQNDFSESKESEESSFEIDGFTVNLKGYSREEFEAEYEKAKKTIGGIFWNPKNLKVENGEVNEEHFSNQMMQYEQAEASWTSAEKDHIIATPRMLAHELVHFLLGPEATKNWPAILEDIVACSVDELVNYIEYDELDHPWIQLPVGHAIVNNSPLMITRYAALQHIGNRHASKMSAIVKKAFERGKISFDELAGFLEQFGIGHHILSPGESALNSEIIPYGDEEKNGYIIIRYKREKGVPEEYGWIGPFQPNFIDEEGNIYEGPVLQMEGLAFFPSPPNLLSPLAKIIINCPDGQLTREF
ncbi:hypothetical protein ACFL21_03910 [Patescibacteria group bacterium]